MRKDRFSAEFLILPLVILWAVFGIYRAGATTVQTRLMILSVCGNGILEGAEQCDVPSDPGTYSTAIAGRNCTSACAWAPYCGDSIVQTIYSEECDDGNNADNDFCASDCRSESVPPGTGTGGSTGGSGNGGSGPFNPGSGNPVPDTHVSITGKAYPHSNVNVLRDGKVIGVVKANALADFLFTISGTTPGTSTFGFWAEDDKGLRSIAFNTTLQVVQGAVTTISGVFIPPTIEVSKKVAGKGEIINISGSSIPDSKITTVINSSHEIRTNVESDDKGKWSFDFNTAPLETGAHSAKSFFNAQLYDYVAKSEFSQTVSFFVGTEASGEPKGSDLNGDNKVNLVDFSILLFNWGTAGKGTVSDLNSDDIVNLTDFSILLFNWTG